MILIKLSVNFVCIICGMCKSFELKIMVFGGVVIGNIKV